MCPFFTGVLMKNPSRIIFKIVVALILVGLLSPDVFAQQWPTGVTKILVPYLTGTAPDTMARLMARKLSEKTGKPFIVENKPGANSIIGTGYVVHAPADGSVILLVDTSALVVNPLLYKSLPYDARKDLASVSLFGDDPMYLIASAEFPPNNWAEFVAYAKAHPGKVVFGSGGNGHISHLNLESMQDAAGIKLLHVPYKGMADVIPALLSNTAQVSISGIGNVEKLVEQKKIKVFAIGGANRSSLTPGVPSTKELTGNADMIISTAFSLHVPAATPAATVQKISQAAAAVLTDPEVLKFTSQLGYEARASTPQALDQRLDQFNVVFSKIVKDHKIQIQN